MLLKLKKYDLNPLFLFFVQIFVSVFFLGDDEIHVNNGNENVNAENTSDQNVDNKKVEYIHVIICNRSCF